MAKIYTSEELSKQFHSNPKILYASEGIHGDQFEIFSLNDGTFAVYIWNDGFPNRMGGGGAFYQIPEELTQNFSTQSFANHFNANHIFRICPLLSDEEVQAFFKNNSL